MDQCPGEPESWAIMIKKAIYRGKIRGMACFRQCEGENPMVLYLRHHDGIAGLVLVSGMKSGLPLRLKRSQTSSKYSR